MPNGWFDLMGLSVVDARKLFLERLVKEAIQDYLPTFNEEKADFYIVYDDGFDDACDYNPTLFLIEQRKMAFENPPYSMAGAHKEWVITDKKLRSPWLASRALSPAERDMVLSLVPTNFGKYGGSAGIAAIVASGRLHKVDKYDVRAENLKWLHGPKWQACRIERL